MIGLNERVATLEAEIKEIHRIDERQEEKQDEILKELKEQRELLEDMKRESERYKGFFGGAIWTVMALGTFLYQFGGPIYGWIMRIKGNH